MDVDCTKLQAEAERLGKLAREPMNDRKYADAYTGYMMSYAWANDPRNKQYQSLSHLPAHYQSQMNEIRSALEAQSEAANAAAADCEKKQMEARGEEGSISAEHDILNFLGALGQLSEQQQSERLKRKKLEKIIESQERRKRAREVIKRAEEKAEEPKHDDAVSLMGAIVIESLISEGAGALQRGRSRGGGSTGGGTTGGGGTKQGGGCTGGTCRTR